MIVSGVIWFSMYDQKDFTCECDGIIPKYGKVKKNTQIGFEIVNPRNIQMEEDVIYFSNGIVRQINTVQINNGK